MSLPPSYNLLKKHPNKWFVETGSFRGDAIQLALDADFRHIISMDNDPEAINFCRDRFDLRNPHNPLNEKIMLLLGDSANILGAALRMIREPATIFLDAHWQLIEGTERGPNPFPLMDELDQIGDHDIRTHTIIIDDYLYMTHPLLTHIKTSDILRKIHDIHVNYKVEFIGNPVVNNMLVAYI